MAYNKYYVYKEQVSTDNGLTWSYTGNETPSGSPIATYDILAECEGTQQYRTLTTATTCVGYDKYTLAEYQISYDSGVTWTTTGTSATTLVEADSDDCYPPIQEIDMTGKLYVVTRVDGSTPRNVICNPNPAETGYQNIIAQTDDVTIHYGAITRADIGAVHDYVYIGSCVSEIRSQALANCRFAIYFADGKTYSLPSLLFYKSHIREVLLGGENIYFTTGGDTAGENGVFYRGSGDISEIIYRLKNVAPKCFMEGEFGETAIFGQKVSLHEYAFFWSSFTSLVFNSGFTFASGVTVRDVFSLKYGSMPTITLNGSITNYPEDIVNSLTSGGCTVIDNTTT